ncbi:hypothetical protein OIU84_002611, partial [Salix udensis]
MDILGGSASASPCSSYHQSPCASYNPSPASSSFPSPVSSRYAANGNGNGNPDANSLIPWLRNLSSGSSSASPKHPHHLFIHTGSISAPVTPPLSSPTARTARTRNDWDDPAAGQSWMGQNYSFLPSSMPSSTPPSPGRQVLPDSGWLAGAGSRMWTPGQSGTCSPAVPAGMDQTADVPMSDSMAAEFAFGSNAVGLVKPWEGERIHEEFVSDDLELTLGNSNT